MDVVVKMPLTLKTKLFCSCSDGFCPVCRGMAGALPLLNREAVNKIVLAAHLLDCRLNMASFFRVCGMAENKTGYIRSMRNAPFGIGTDGIIKHLYLEESAVVHEGELCAGEGLICISFSIADKELIQNVITKFTDNEITDGRAFFCFTDDKSELTVLPKDACSIPDAIPSSEGMSRGFLTPDGFIGASDYPTEPDIDSSLVLIDPYSAKKITHSTVQRRKNQRHKNAI